MSDQTCHQHACSCQIASSSVHQTLDELEFERGIWSAAQSGDLDRVNHLIGKGTPSNQCDKSGYTALHYAARNGHYEVCRILLQHGVCVNATTRAGGATALQRACSAGQIKIVQLLLNKGANVHMQDTDGKTALHRAAEKGYEEIYTLLQQYVKNPSVYDSKDHEGNTALDYFVTNKTVL